MDRGLAAAISPPATPPAMPPASRHARIHPTDTPGARRGEQGDIAGKTAGRCRLTAECRCGISAGAMFCNCTSGQRFVWCVEEGYNIMRSFWVAVGAFFVAAGMLPFGAEASLVKCQGSLSKISTKYQGTVEKSLLKCATGVLKAFDKGVAPSSGSEGAVCEAAIVKMNAAYEKSLAKCLGSKCTRAELLLLGHLPADPAGLAGPEGQGLASVGLPPGVNDFVCAYVLQKAECVAYQKFLEIYPRVPGLMAAVQSGNATLTAFNAAQPRCEQHACSLTNRAGALVGSLLVPISVGGSMSIGVSQVPTGSSLSTDYRLLTGVASKRIAPVSVSGNTVCFSHARLEGYCDCGGGAIGPNTVAICRDSDTGDGQDCTVTADILDDAAGSTANGPAYATYSGATVTGSCTGMIGISTTIVVGGGTGADGVACSGDEGAVPGPVVNLPFSTGPVSSSIRDSDNTNGVTRNDSRTGQVISSCGNLDASILTNLRLAISAPFMESGLGGDTAVGLELQCN